jgi:hypothetical protein
MRPFLLLAIRAMAATAAPGSEKFKGGQTGGGGHNGGANAGSQTDTQARNAKLKEDGFILHEDDIIKKIKVFITASRDFRTLVGMAKKPGLPTGAGNTAALITNDITEDLESNPAGLREAGTYKSLMGDQKFDFTRKTAEDLMADGEATAAGNSIGSDAVEGNFEMASASPRKFIAGDKKDAFNSIRMAKEYLANLMGYYDGMEGTRHGYNPNVIPGPTGEGEFKPGSTDDNGNQIVPTEAMLQGTRYEVQEGSQAPLLAAGEQETSELILNPPGGENRDGDKAAVVGARSPQLGA